MRTPLRALIATLALASHTLAAPDEVPLWPEPVAKHRLAESAEDKRETGRLDRWVSYVSEPSLSFYPAPGNSRAAPVVLVIPGGGYRFVCIDKEGVEPAQWLNSRGYAAAVLKYRTLDPQGERSPKTIEPLFADTERAVRLLRSRAGAWKIDPNRIGVLGFSAGAVMGLRLTMDADGGNASAADPVERESSHPNAVGIVYGGVIGKLQSPARLPPFFVVHAVDDPKAPVGVVQAITKYVQDAKGSFEAHVFRRGDHGFGIQPTSGTVKAWPDLFAAWLSDVGFNPVQ